jgi:hypothetical protein
VTHGHAKHGVIQTAIASCLVFILLSTSWSVTRASAVVQTQGIRAHIAKPQPGMTCPTQVVSSSKPSGILQAIQQSMPRYFGAYNAVHYRILLLSSLGNGGQLLLRPTWRKMATAVCGTHVANSSWIAFLGFSDASKALSANEGELFLAQTRTGWKVWMYR